VGHKRTGSVCGVADVVLMIGQQPAELFVTGVGGDFFSQHFVGGVAEHIAIDNRLRVIKHDDGIAAVEHDAFDDIPGVNGVAVAVAVIGFADAIIVGIVGEGRAILQYGGAVAIGHRREPIAMIVDILPIPVGVGLPGCRDGAASDIALGVVLIGIKAVGGGAIVKCRDMTGIGAVALVGIGIIFVIRIDDPGSGPSAFVCRNNSFPSGTAGVRTRECDDGNSEDHFEPG
jgi:hypothetical protein